LKVRLEWTDVRRSPIGLKCERRVVYGRAMNIMNEMMAGEQEVPNKRVQLVCYATYLEGDIYTIKIIYACARCKINYEL
jgi:hypothetical protein